MSPSESDTVADRLADVVAEFSDLEGREKLELLLEFADRLPPLPPAYQQRRSGEDHRVHECQTPVFLWPEIIDRQAQLVAEVAPEAPTVKGFVAILAEAVARMPADEAIMLPDDLLERLGLADVLGILRSRGLRAIVGHVRRGILAAAANSQAS